MYCILRDPQVQMRISKISIFLKTWHTLASNAAQQQNCPVAKVFMSLLPSWPGATYVEKPYNASTRGKQQELNHSGLSIPKWLAAAKMLPFSEPTAFSGCIGATLQLVSCNAENMKENFYHSVVDFCFLEYSGL